MKLQAKLSFPMASVFALSILGGLVVAALVILPQFSEIEDDDARKDMARVHDAIG